LLSASQFILGVGAIDSILTTSIFAVLALTGSLVWKLLKVNPTETFYELVGIGFPIGASLTALIVLITRTLGIYAVPTWLCALILPVLIGWH
jgi:hypothetical protein